jgi:hypothetical protein
MGIVCHSDEVYTDPAIVTDTVRSSEITAARVSRNPLQANSQPRSRYDPVDTVVAQAPWSQWPDRLPVCVPAEVAVDDHPATERVGHGARSPGCTWPIVPTDGLSGLTALFCVVAGAPPVDDHDRLVADDPCVVALGQCGHLTGDGVEGGAVGAQPRPSGDGAWRRGNRAHCCAGKALALDNRAIHPH